ncbi:MAG: AmmeMemoRadiSam system protein B [Elusimicrobia bacterium]|nr:AmmeMemoRadiSam system protein B [Elusimicrobiota bacterium]
MARARPPAAAGSFYEARPAVLRAAVDRMLAEAPDERPEGRLVAALCPHAGHQYSGPPTARVCRALARLKPEIIAVVGTAHYARSEGFFLDDHSAFQTPLGEVPAARAEAERLLESGAGVAVSTAAHDREHSIEVVLPFLQRSCPAFRLLPMVASSQSLSESERVGRALAEALKGRRAVVVAATDLSHYPALENARRVDAASLESFLTLDPDFLWRTEQCLMSLAIPDLRCTWCGKAAAACALSAGAALGADWAESLGCTNSADGGGDARRTVGYGAALLLARGRRRPWPSEALSEPEKTALLALARESVKSALQGRRPSPRLFDYPRLNLPAAVFVTWTGANAELRGCIGTTHPHDTLGNAVARYAVLSATEDSRFPGIFESELDGLRAKISILSEPQVARPEDIKPGLGVMVGRGRKSGLFLPQVWEKLPDREGFMAHLCEHKAGLRSAAWKEPGIELFTFTVNSFAEP